MKVNALISQGVFLPGQTVNPQVPGSSPGRGARIPFKSKHLALAFNLTY